ncbi:MAG TPA: NAD(P)-binding domain-containing protein, partial [Thermoleophilaceae bacterium]|nr:NAD(P)-binding domain-containing protein [Thermoleophilaceae bacterium]
MVAVDRCELHRRDAPVPRPGRNGSWASSALFLAVHRRRGRLSLRRLGFPAVRLGFIGAGNMASALARGIGEPVLVADIDADKAQALATELDGEAVGSNAELAERADAVVLCHKPQQLDEVAAEVAGRADAVVSILAAVSTDRLWRAYPGTPVYRFIPNLPAEVRKGVLCYVPGPGAGQGPESEVLELFGRVGAVIALDSEP